MFDMTEMCASVRDVCLQALIQQRTKKIIIAMIPACCLLTAFTLINLRRVVKVQSSMPYFYVAATWHVFPLPRTESSSFFLTARRYYDGDSVGVTLMCHRG